jgi:phosphate-selective porin OprO/OprP
VTEDPAAAEPSRLHFELGWDYGPTYSLVQRLPILRKYDPTGVMVQDVLLSGRIGGSLSLDGGYLGGDALDNGFDGRVRRARFFTRGAFTYGFPTEYKFEFAIESKRVFLNDFFLRWRFSRFIDTLRFGYFDPPVSLEALAASADRSLMEVGAPVAAFAPGYRLGIEADGTSAEHALTWGLNVSTVGQEQETADASTSDFRATGRLVWRPWGDAEPDPTALIHLGVSLEYTFAGSGRIQYRARPESFLAPYVVDTGPIESGDAMLLAVEAAWRHGPVSVQAEYFASFVDGKDVGARTFQGAYLQASWVLTGEQRPYDRATALFGRVEPREPFAPLRGRWGALEVAWRVSWLDLSDGPVRGGRIVVATVGPAWVLNRWVRIEAGYVAATIGDRPGGSHAQIFQARLELRL